MEIVYKIDDFADPGDQDVYNGIQEINKNNYINALGYFEKASNQENEFGVLFSGILYFTGFGLVQRKPQKAMELFRKAVSRWDSPVAYYFIGIMYLEGDDGIPINKKSGIYWISLAAHKGWFYAMAHLGNIYLLGGLGWPDHKKAIRWFEKVDSHMEFIDNKQLYLFGNKKFVLHMSRVNPTVVKLINDGSNESMISLIGWARAYKENVLFISTEIHRLTFWDILANKKSTVITTCQKSMASIYFDGANNVSKDLNKAIDWTKKAAKNGCYVSANTLAIMYEFGIDVKQDYLKAMEYYKLFERPEFFFRLGTFYYGGKGVQINYELALAYFKAAVRYEDHGYAYFLMGEIYRDGGYGVLRDYKKAYTCYEEAFDMGVSVGATEIGKLYRMGLGVEQNEEKAYDWFSHGASMGCSRAYYALGLLYFNGYKGEVDYDKALFFFLNSAIAGFEPAAHMMNQTLDILNN